MTKCDERGRRSVLRLNRVTSFMDDPLLFVPATNHKHIRIHRPAGPVTALNSLTRCLHDVTVLGLLTVRSHVISSLNVIYSESVIQQVQSVALCSPPCHTAGTVRSSLLPSCHTAATVCSSLLPSCHTAATVCSSVLVFASDNMRSAQYDTKLCDIN